MHLRASTTLWLLGALSRPRPPPQWQCTTGRQPCTLKRGGGGKWLIVFSKQNKFYMASDNADNASQSIYKPFISGGPHSPAAMVVAYGLGHPTSLKVMKKIEPSKSVKKK